MTIRDLDSPKYVEEELPSDPEEGNVEMSEHYGSELNFKLGNLKYINGTFQINMKSFRRIEEKNRILVSEKDKS